MSSMQAAVLYGAEDVRIEPVSMPVPGPGEVRMRVQVALTCGTDIKVYKRGYHAKMIRPPAIFGHEFAGVIDAVGPNVTNWQIGQAVVAANSAPCSECLFCKHDQPELCSNLLFLNGAYAQYIVVPARITATNLLSVPPHLSFAEAALLEPLACVVHGMQRIAIQPGETVILLGLGPIGLLFVRLCALAGAKVLAVGRRSHRLALAKELGAMEAFDEEQGESNYLQWLLKHTEQGMGADCVIEAVGSPTAWEKALVLVRPGGRVCFFGGCPPETSISLDTHRLHYEEVTLLSAFHHTPATVRKALQLLADGAIPTTRLLQHQASLSQLPQVLSDLAYGRQEAIKVVIYPNA